LRLIPDVAAPPVRQAAILRVHAVLWHRVYVGTDRHATRHAVAIAWVIPPEVIIVVVTAMASIGPVRTATVARPVVIPASTWPVVIPAATWPTRKAVIDMSAAAKPATGPVIITAAGRSMMKAVIDLSAAAIAATAEVAAAPPAAAATATPPRVTVING
jgi:hypothetical protein